MLDLSDAFCPDNLDVFAVNRRAQTVDDGGFAHQTPTTIPGVRGVVTAATPNDLERLPDEQHGTKAIVIVTKFRLQLPSPNFDADTVQWHGDEFVVVHVDDYTSYGHGFLQAIAISINSIEQPPPA